jgi:hypothetical protein
MSWDRELEELARRKHLTVQLGGGSVKSIEIEGRTLLPSIPMWQLCVDNLSQVPVVARVGHTLDKNELGGSDIHTNNGAIDDEAASEVDAFAMARAPYRRSNSARCPGARSSCARCSASPARRT